MAKTWILQLSSCKKAPLLPRLIQVSFLCFFFFFPFVLGPVHRAGPVQDHKYALVLMQVKRVTSILQMRKLSLWRVRQIIQGLTSNKRWSLDLNQIWPPLKPMIFTLGFSISQGHRFRCFYSQQQYCLSRSLQRQMGCPTVESQTFLIKYLLSNCSLKLR